MKVKQKNKIMVALHSLSVGDGFLFNDFPHVVCESRLAHQKGLIPACNLTNAMLVAIPLMEQVQPIQIEVEYTL